MELHKCLKTVEDIDDYIHFTRDVENKGLDLKIPFNMSTVLSLKTIQSIEIEYFNKCEENGAATKIFEYMLRLPPSKTWSLLGKELVCLLQYWLEAIRKHLIIHNTQWWIFLKLILRFIKEIRTKDSSINKILIEETGDCILDLATHSAPEPMQRLEIVQTFNIFSAESSRKVRFAFKDKFQKYFTKLSRLLPEAGDLRLQHGVLETLLRWLLPRHAAAVRQAAAAAWFPRELCSGEAVRIFLERPWQNFMRDARDFLNARNESSELVTSVFCKKFAIGSSVSISIDYWLDINSSTKCISLLLEPKFLEKLGVEQNCDVMVISEENTFKVELDKQSSGVVIKLTALELSLVYPFSDTDSNTLRFDVNTSCNVLKLDRALCGVFKEKYQPLFDVDTFKPNASLTNEQESLNAIDDTDDNVRFSIPSEVPRRKHSGFLLFRKRNESRKSPSTVSTSSLAQLHEKLAALPPFSYDKELVSVCALPQLSNVTEVSEIEETRTISTSATTVKLKPCEDTSNKFSKPTKSSQSISEESQQSGPNILSPVKNDENSISCLLVATIGSNDDSVISDTINRLPQGVPCNTDNIVALLVQEALQYNTDKQDGSISNTDNNSDVCQQNKFFNVDTRTHAREKAVESFSNLVANPRQDNVNNLAMIDDSSNEIVDTPVTYVNKRKSKRIIERNNPKSIPEPSKVPYWNEERIELNHDGRVVEDFFSKHFSENQNGQLVISPTLAKKINETSSECSADFEFCLSTNNYVVQDADLDPHEPDLDVVECLKDMLDKVCEDFDKCTKNLGYIMEDIECMEVIEIINDSPLENNPQANKATSKCNENQECVSKEKENTSKAVKQKYTKKKSLSCKRILEPNVKVDNKKPPLMLSPIIEKHNVVGDSVRKDVISPAKTPTEAEPRVLRRKRKLYSPKNEQSHKNTVVHITESQDDTNTNSEIKTNFELKSKPESMPKRTSSCYKELEMERKMVRKPRTRRSKSNILSIASPRTQKLNQIFDSLKDVNNGEPIKLVDKNLDENLAVYNYTSDSDVEEVKKQSNSNTGLEKNPITATGSIKTKKTRARKTVKQTTATNTTTNLNNETKKPTTTQNLKRKRNPPAKRKLTKTQKDPVIEIMEQKSNLEDERMRKGTPERLDTSLVIEVPNDEKRIETEPEPILKDVPQMEYITDGKPQENSPNKKEDHGRPKTRNMLSLKRNKDVVRKAGSDVSNERTLSPLPGLVVETVLVTDEDLNDLNSSNMIQKFKDIYQGKKAVDTDVNTTHNLLSDIEPINDSVPNLKVTEELNKQTDNSPHYSSKISNKSVRADKSVKENYAKSSNKNLQTRLKRELRSTKSRASADIEVIQLTCTENDIEKSMPTQGNKSSPITGHGDFNEKPPNSTLLKDDIEPRLVEEENYSHSLKDFFLKLNTELYESDFDYMSDVRKRISSGKGTKDVITSKNDGSVSNRTNNDRSSCKSRSDGEPVVVLRRLSLSKDFNLSSLSEFTDNITKHNSKNIPSTSDKETNTVERKVKTTVASNIKPSKSSSNTKIDRKTMISPIRLSEDFTIKNVTSKSPEPKKEDCLSRVRSILSTKKQTKGVESNHSKISNISRQSSSGSVILRYESTSSKKTSKRMSSPIMMSSKKSKLELNNNVGDSNESAEIESGPSLLSVDDWFKRIEPTCTADNVKSTMKEIPKYLLEKLNTTLVEVHHNTSKRFVNMFVNKEKNSRKSKEKRRELYKETFSEIISEVVNVMDTKFSDLEKRLQSMDEESTCALKEECQEILREDCKQKRLMVTMLQEDIQAIQDHMCQ